MQHPVFDFLGSALVPELGSDVAAGAAGNKQLCSGRDCRSLGTPIPACLLASVII